MNSTESFNTEMQELARAGYPLVAVQTYEEVRALACLKNVAYLLTEWEQKKCEERELPEVDPWKFYAYSPTMGLYEINGGARPVKFAASGADDNPLAALGMTKASATADTRKLPVAMQFIGQLEKGIVALCDVNPLLKDPMAVRMLREAAWAIDGKDVRVDQDSRQVMIVLVAPVAPDDDTLAKEMKIVDLKLPSEDEMLELVFQKTFEAEQQGIHVALPLSAGRIVARALLGLSFTEATNLLAKSIVHSGELSEACVEDINREKAAIIKGIVGLTYREPQPPDGIGGYGTAVAAIDDGSITMDPEAEDFGVDPHRGILEVGIAGCGKTYSAEVASGRMKRGLLELDWGAVTGAGGGIVGQGELALRRGLEMCDLLHPILLIDEAEKMMSGLESSGRTDGGMQSRMIGKFMSWQSRQRGTFVIGTCNSVERLDTAQKQLGRWSEFLFFDLPNVGERKQIIDIHIKRRKFQGKARDPKKYRVDMFAQLTEGFSGRELEVLVQRAVLRAYRIRKADNDSTRDLTDEDFLAEIRTFNPSSKSDPEAIKRIKDWAESAGCRRANDPEDEPPATEGSRKARRLLV